MVTDLHVRKLRYLDRQGVSKEMAAARAGIDPKTARKYRQLGRLPSEVRLMDRDWRTKPDPFATVWPQLEALLDVNPGLEAKTLFAELQRQFPGRFAAGQLRTLQRRVKQWRAVAGPAKEVFFGQVHYPGRLCASDFTHCSSLRVTIQGVPFDHLIYHFVLTYSNWETGTVCFAESYESLSEGLQNALGELGGVPQLHRTDRLTAAVPPGTTGASFSERYQGLLRHYGLRGQAIQAGKGNENGDAEQSHHRFKRALEQALLLRGSRDFASRAAYEAFLRLLFEQLNRSRQPRLAEELPRLRALPARRLESCKRVTVRVDRGSTLHIEGNVYSVSSRLIGEWVEARVGADQIEVWYAQQCVERLPRLRGRGKHRIEYRHVIDWLVRKPGAFADYRYHADLFPSSGFRLAYDLLLQQAPSRAAKEYLGILQLAARQSESGTAAALARLFAAGKPLSVAAVAEEMQRSDIPMSLPHVVVGLVDLASYDELFARGKEAEDGEGREGEAGALSEGAAPAGVAAGLRGAGASGASGGAELRAVPAEPGGARVSAAAEQPDRASAEAVASAAGEELAGAGAEAAAVEGAAADAEPAGRIVRGPSRERAGVRGAGIGQDALVVRAGPGVGAGGSEGAVLDDGPAGAGAAGGEAGPEAVAAAEASVAVRGADPGRPGLRAAEPGGDGGAVCAAGGAVRAGECAADEQPGVLAVGDDLQGPDDDGGGDRPSGASLGDHRDEPAELPCGAGEEGEAEPGERR